MEEVVTQHQGYRVVADELLANQECLGQPVRGGLDSILQVQAPVAAVPQQLLEAWCVLGVEITKMS